MENPPKKDGYWRIESKDTQDLHPKIPKTIFSSSGYLLLLSCMFPKAVQLFSRSRRSRKTETGHPYAEAKRICETWEKPASRQNSLLDEMEV